MLLTFLSYVFFVTTVTAYTYKDVTIEQGVVRGYNDESEDVYGFYGIPYATAPTGEDKFKAPLPPPVWDGIFNATEKFIVCHQKVNDALANRVTEKFDCLRLNVYVPDINKTNLPVLVHIHGGSWQSGYADSYNPIPLVQKGLVVVHMTYRVSLLGFLCLGTEYAPGNAGLKDQVEALKWVKKNIARFGGDPDNVSMSGNSVGSVNVELHMLSPQSNGLFVKAIPESGSALLSEIILDPLEIAETYANEQYGIYSNGNVSILEQFYRSLTEEQLSVPFIGSFYDPGFVPCVETHNLDGVEKFLPERPFDIITRGKYNKMPLLTGFTAYEGLNFIDSFNNDKPLMESNLTAFIPKNLKIVSEEQAREVTKKIRDLYFPDGEVTYLSYIIYHGDVTFAYPQYLSARLHAKNLISDVYLYYYTFNGTINLPKVRSSPFKGPGHVVESLYLRNYTTDPTIYDNMTESDYLMRERLQTMWYNFCKYGTPVPSRTDLLDFEWLPVTENKTYYASLDKDFSLGIYPLRERFDMWNELYGFNE